MACTKEKLIIFSITLEFRREFFYNPKRRENEYSSRIQELNCLSRNKESKSLRQMKYNEQELLIVLCFPEKRLHMMKTILVYINKQYYFLENNVTKLFFFYK